jgi:hypothetical protein
MRAPSRGPLGRPSSPTRPSKAPPFEPPRPGDGSDVAPRDVQVLSWSEQYFEHIGKFGRQQCWTHGHLARLHPRAYRAEPGGRRLRRVAETMGTRPVPRMMSGIRSRTRSPAGVDTHIDTHTAAALDGWGNLRGHQAFPTTGAGYTQLLAWLTEWGPLVAVGSTGPRRVRRSGRSTSTGDPRWGGGVHPGTPGGSVRAAPRRPNGGIPGSDPPRHQGIDDSATASYHIANKRVPCAWSSSPEQHHHLSSPCVELWPWCTHFTKGAMSTQERAQGQVPDTGHTTRYGRDLAGNQPILTKKPWESIKKWKGHYRGS